MICYIKSSAHTASTTIKDLLAQSPLQCHGKSNRVCWRRWSSHIVPYFMMLNFNLDKSRKHGHAPTE